MCTVAEGKEQLHVLLSWRRKDIDYSTSALDFLWQSYTLSALLTVLRYLFSMSFTTFKDLNKHPKPAVPHSSLGCIEHSCSLFFPILGMRQGWLEDSKVLRKVLSRMKYCVHPKP